MATNNAKLTKYAGGRDVWGGHGVFMCYITGQASYQGGVGGGDLIIPVGGNVALAPGLGAGNCPLRSIDAIIASIDSTGTYELEAGPFGGVAVVNTPPKVWAVRWLVISTGVEVANAVNLSAAFAVLTIIGG